MHPRVTGKCLRGLRRDIWNGLAPATCQPEMLLFICFMNWVFMCESLQGRVKKKDIAAKNSTRKPASAKGKYEECF